MLTDFTRTDKGGLKDTRKQVAGKCIFLAAEYVCETYRNKYMRLDPQGVKWFYKRYGCMYLFSIAQHNWADAIRKLLAQHDTIQTRDGKEHKCKIVFLHYVPEQAIKMDIEDCRHMGMPKEFCKRKLKLEDA